MDIDVTFSDIDGTFLFHILSAVQYQLSSALYGEFFVVVVLFA